MQFAAQSLSSQQQQSGRSPVKLIGFRRRCHDDSSDDVMTPVSPLDSPRLSTAAFSSSDADLSSTAHSPARRNPRAAASGGGGVTYGRSHGNSGAMAAMSRSSSSSSSSSLGTLFHRLNIRRSSTASSLESSPRKQHTGGGGGGGHSSDDDSGVGHSDAACSTAAAAATSSSSSSGMLSKLRKKSKSVGALRRRRKAGECGGLRRQAAAHSDLMDVPPHQLQLQHGGGGATSSTTSSSLTPSSLGVGRSKSLDLLAEAVCPACRLQSLAATDSGVGSMSLTAPTDSPLWLGWHSADGGGDDGLGNHGKHGGGGGGGGDSQFLAQAQSNPDILTACDNDDGDDNGTPEADGGGLVEVNRCRECGCLFRETLANSPNVRVEFEQDYMC